MNENNKKQNENVLNELNKMQKKILGMILENQNRYDEIISKEQEKNMGVTK